MNKKKNNKVLGFGIDIGNGFVKADDGKNEIIVAPSSFMKKSKLGTSRLDIKDERFGIDYQEYSVKKEDELHKTVVWGPGLTDPNFSKSPGDILTTSGAEHRYSNKFFKEMVSIVLSEMAIPHGTEIDCAVVTGMPSGELDSIDSGEIQAAFEGKHQVIRNDQLVTVNVMEIIVIEQPLGTVMNKFILKSGDIDEEFSKSKIAVIDFGSGTTIIDVYHNGNRIPEESTTLAFGMNMVFKRVADSLSSRLTTKVYPTQIQHATINQMNSLTDKYTLILNSGVRIPFAKELQDALEEHEEMIYNHLKSLLLYLDEYKYFFITGGGVHLLKDLFIQDLGESAKARVIVDENPQTASVQGFRKLAQALALQLEEG